jgi:hypothetical protein
MPTRTILSKDRVTARAAAVTGARAGSPKLWQRVEVNISDENSHFCGMVASVRGTEIDAYLFSSRGVQDFLERIPFADPPLQDGYSWRFLSTPLGD